MTVPPPTATLPKGWLRVSIDEITDVQGGIQKQPKRQPRENAAPFLRVANVLRGSLDLSDVHSIEVFDGEMDRYSLRHGDLLVVEGNGSPEQIGRAAMWRDEISGCVHQNHLIRVRPGPAVLPKYLAVAWNSSEIIEQLRRVASSTSGLYTLSTRKTKSIELSLPPGPEQARILALLDGHLSRLEAAERELDRLAVRAGQLRRSLMTEGLAGRLVAQDPGDEPAEVLLERIRRERAAQPKPRRARRSVSGAQEEALL